MDTDDPYKVGLAKATKHYLTSAKLNAHLGFWCFDWECACGKDACVRRETLGDVFEDEWHLLEDATKAFAVHVFNESAYGAIMGAHSPTPFATVADLRLKDVGREVTITDKDGTVTGTLDRANAHYYPPDDESKGGTHVIASVGGWDSLDVGTDALVEFHDTEGAGA